MGPHAEPPTESDPGSDRPEVGETIERAVEIIGARHRVRPLSAYTMLVQAAVDAHSSVAEAAERINTEADRAPPRAP